jgi:hypothetical protein
VILCLVAWLEHLLVMTSVNATTDDDSEYLIADHCVVTVTPIYALTAGVASFFGPAALLLLLTAVLGLVAACSTRVTGHSTTSNIYRKVQLSLGIKTILVHIMYNDKTS